MIEGKIQGYGVYLAPAPSLIWQEYASRSASNQRHDMARGIIASESFMVESNSFDCGKKCRLSNNFQEFFRMEKTLHDRALNVSLMSLHKSFKYIGVLRARRLSVEPK